MNYHRVISSYQGIGAFEEKCDQFAQETAAKNHRIMATKFSATDDGLYALFIVNDEPHPHKRQ